MTMGGEVRTIRRPASRRCVAPLARSTIPAGFPSPADDYLHNPLDLGARLVANPDATFLVEVAGNSMINAGIHPGDLLVVDRSVDAHDGNIVVAEVNREFTVKRLRRRNGQTWLVAENPDYLPITFTDGDEMAIWGVVRHVIKDV